MKTSVILFLIVLTAPAFAQATDSLYTRYDSLAEIHTSSTDAALRNVSTKIDATQQRLSSILSPDFNKLTPQILESPTSVSDSLSAIRELDSMKLRLTHKIDSLKTLNLPTSKYTRKLDSLNQIGPARYVQMVQQRKQALEDKIKNPIDNVNQKVSNVEDNFNGKLDLIRQQGGTNLPNNLSLDKASPNIPSVDTSLPGTGNLNTNVPGISNPLSDVNNPLGAVSSKANNLTSVPQQQIDKLKSVDEIQTVNGKMGNINAVTDKVQAYGKDATSIAQGNIGDAQQIPESIEDRAKSLDEIKELEKQTGELTRAKGMIDNGNDPQALKEMVKQEVTKLAVDHFAGKQEALRTAMDKIGKLKSKYSEAKSLADLPKRAPNPMKGKPHIERLIPGITLQVQKSNTVIMDLNPVISYRFTGRLNAGVGWNERLSFTKWNKLNAEERIFGPRAFGSFSFRKGFGLKAEIEKMNALIPSNALSADAGTRQWVWSAFVGMKKDYKFMGKVNGNVQVLYNIYDDHDNSPYSDRLNVRIGFELPMKKKLKPM